MLTKEQQTALERIAKRDGAYLCEQTDAGTRYSTMGGEEILIDVETRVPSELEQLKARVAALEARL